MSNQAHSSNFVVSHQEHWLKALDSSNIDFVKTGTAAILFLPNKPHLTMDLDLNSHLPFCLATQSTNILTQGQDKNLCVTAESNQNLTTSLKLLLTWHFHFGHLNFSTVKWMCCSGIFGKNSIFSFASQYNHPKCVACKYRKVGQQPTQSKLQKPVHQREDALEQNILFP